MKVTLLRAALVAAATGLTYCAGGAEATATPDRGVQAALELQQAFTCVAERAFPSVVVITNKQAYRVTRGHPQIPPEFRYFFGLPDTPDEQPGPSPGRVRPVGRGSGVIVGPSGYIVTNYHVIAENDALEVKLHDGRVFDSSRDEAAVQVIGVDEETDLAVIRVGGGDLDDLPTLAFADSDQVKVGQWAIAVGAPFNFDYSVTVGVVSQKGRYDVNMNTYENYLQTDASINPGNSGGPLLNLRGEVMGINDFIVSGGGYSRGSIGLGFAIASNLARQVVEQIIDLGEVSRPWLGIAMQELSEGLKGQFDVGHGVLIRDVIPGDPAEKAGLKVGDVILEVGGKEVRTPHDVQFAVLRYHPGDTIDILVDRRGERKTIRVEARRKDSLASARGGARGGRDLLTELGLQLEVADEKLTVTAVAAGSAAAAAELRAGDIVHEVNRQRAVTLEEVAAALDETRNGLAVLYVERRGAKFFVPLRIKAEGN